MRKHWATKTILAIGAAVCALTGAWANATSDGKWTLQRSDRPGMVQLAMHSSRRGQFNYLSDRPQNEFSGLDLAQDTQFTLARDAGKFEFEGTLRNGAGAGTFKFLPNAAYPREMQALGFGGVEGKQMHFALHDVSLSFAREIKDANLQGVDADELLAFRIHGVSRKFIDGIRAAGLSERDSDQFIAFRIHGVTPELIQRVAAAGYEPDSKSLISMRIHGATPEYMDDLKRQGYEGVPMDQLIAFRIHGVTPDFIGELRQLGFERPAPEQLVQLRIHGVTPDYIGQLQRRGVKNLTIDQLVAMKIHGLD